MFSAGGSARRLRQILGEAMRGVDDHTIAQLGVFASFRSLALLWDAGWLGEGRASVRITSAEIRQWLRTIAAARRPTSEIATAAHGDIVLVHATVSGMLPPHDFLLGGGDGDPVLVRGSGARVLGWVGDIAPGTAVTVLGYAEQVVDPHLVATAPRLLPRRAVIRSDELPVVVAPAPAAKTL